MSHEAMNPSNIPSMPTEEQLAGKLCFQVVGRLDAVHHSEKPAGSDALIIRRLFFDSNLPHRHIFWRYFAMSKIIELRAKRNILWDQTKNFLEEHRGENQGRVQHFCLLPSASTMVALV